MKIWQRVGKWPMIVLVFALLVACSSSGQSNESEGAADSPSPVIQETAAAVAEADGTAEPISAVAQAADDATELPETATGAPEPAFDPENTPDGMVMVYVPEGEFEMGTTDEQKDRLIEQNIWDQEWNYNEQPVHTVYLDAFWIDQTEVTNGQYALCVAEGACQEPYFITSLTRDSYYGNPDFKDYPVTYVDWAMAEAYCAWAGRRLPTEAEWEKAARGTDGRIYPWGDELDSTLANYGGYAREGGDTAAVGSYPDGASPYGALDMAGNIYEWMADEWDNRYYLNSPAENPPGPSFGGKKHVIRGGGWNGTADSLRSAARYGYRTDYRDFPEMGFRCAASP